MGLPADAALPPMPPIPMADPVLSATESGSWRPYLREFAMLFLAISLGFVVDNYREYLSDRERERVLMRQVMDDLRADIANADSNLVMRDWRAAKMDSLLDLHDAGIARERAGDVYYFSMAVRQTYQFTPHGGAFSQLENGGGLQLITKPEVLSALQGYRAAVQWLMTMQALETDQIQRYRNGPFLRMLDPAVLRRITHTEIQDLSRRIVRPEGPVQLVDLSAGTMNEYFALVLNMSAFNGTCRRIVGDVGQHAERVAQLIATTYGFE